MAQRLTRFSVGQTAKMLGVLYFFMGLVFLPFFFVAAALSPKQASFLGVGFAVVVPFLYGILGFIFGAIGCGLYNLAARVTGGIEIQLDPQGGLSQAGLRPPPRT